MQNSPFNQSTPPDVDVIVPVRRKNFLPKLGVLAVMTAMLSACQSTGAINHTTSQTPIHNKAVARLSIEQSLSAAQTAKSSLVAALTRHLAAERYVVSSYQTKVFPLHSTDSPDAQADTLWSSAIKTYAYKNSHDTQSKSGEIYRSNDEYLAMADDLPYLRLPDELAGVLPDDAVSKEVGMSDDYQGFLRQVRAETDSLYSCLADESIALDNLVKQEPTINDGHISIKESFANIDGCIKQADESFAKLQTQAQSYAKSDMIIVRQCAASYRQDIRLALSKQRQHQSLDGEFYDHYDLVWHGYARCMDQVRAGGNLEPAAYLGSRRINVEVDLLEHRCATLTTQAHHALRQNGKNHAQHGQEYLAEYRNYAQCLQDGLYQLSKKDKPSPTIELSSISQISSQLGDLRTELLYGQENTQSIGWLDAYKQMKQQGITQNPPSNTTPANPESLPPQIGVYANMVMSALDHAKQTPEQTLAKNLYQYDRSVVHTLTHHQPSQKRIEKLVVFDQESPTSKVQISVPVRLDFNQAKVSVDASAGLPLLALAPNFALLPSDVPEGIMHFDLPKELQAVVPADMLYLAVHRAILFGIQNTQDELFTPVDASQDAYAKELKATQVIKLNLDLREYGRLLAMIGKEVAKDLKHHIDQQDFADKPAKIQRPKKLIDDWSVINQGYHTADAGGLVAMIDAILPIKLYDSLYYYLNAKGELIGIQQIQSVNDHFSNIKVTIVGRSQYGKQAFDQHQFAASFAQSLAQMDKQQFDGAAWIKDNIQTTRLQAMAKEHRSPENQQLTELFKLLQEATKEDEQNKQDEQTAPNQPTP